MDRDEAEKAQGVWSVRSGCINCDVARQAAPDLIGEVKGVSAFLRQPATETERRQAAAALLACPTGAIVAGGMLPQGEVFPRLLEAGVYTCGFTSPKAYGANSFLVSRPEARYLVDSPRFAGRLVKQLEAMGGITDIFLTHRDHPADSDKYAEHFGARVWIHQMDRGAAPWATDIITGGETREVAPGLQAVVIPGHTAGSVAYVLDETYLFSGDSLYWSRRRDRLWAFRRQCFYSWQRQADSLERLAREHRFSWVLAGHGSSRHLSEAAVAEGVASLVAEMRRDDPKLWDSSANPQQVDW